MENIRIILSKNISGKKTWGFAMCGICGYITKKGITIENLKAMNDTMVHRGPDDSGEEIYDMADGYQIGFAHRRLSILDLSSLGHQPMHSADKRISVIYNGEIYNYPKLREELAGYPFCSHCDTEVIIAAYLKWGADCVKHFNGMFAIALYDRESGEIYLMRDRVGKKPLYYWKKEDGIVFASELKPIMAYPGFPKKIRREVIPRYLFQQYINAPDSIFEDVYKIEPGSVLRFHKGEIITWKYWDIKQVYQKQMADPIKSYEEAKERLKASLQKSVRARMLSDVPLGSFLSGGYDSSLVTAIAQECSDTPVKTFSIGFYEEKYNEAGYAKEVAKYLGTAHTELYIDEQEMFQLVESIPQYYDEPFADSSQIPTMLVSQLAREYVTVALSGDGGDEFFCGYNIYENVSQAQKLDMLGGMVHTVCRLPGFKQIGLEERLPFRVRVIAGNREKESKTQFGAGNYIVKANAMVKKTGDCLPVHYLMESEYGVKNWQIRRMLLDMDTYLPGDILCKMDRASMKYSLEARCPILDTDVMELSYRIPHSYKYAHGDKKHILKDIAYDYIPRELLERPKVGFGVPLDKWMRGPLKEQLLDYSSYDYLKKQDIFDADYTSDMIQTYMRTGDAGPATGANYSKLAWSFFVFQQWYQNFQ
ncbi:MAG: asparagine synthase (glutamine-hydrolyzing) [Bacillus sp. (in: Bacteria)]|nr:asparagine synthase (glutamine-hydrolyzing) [Bacillus sp. (in: firmicutes)]MCM1425468.1 asparagine synthase (glutamine-hydrolyzing) [Eubacterium sp.]